MSGEGGRRKVCFVCLEQSNSSSSRDSAGSLLYIKFISFARQYLQVATSVNHLSQDPHDSFCNNCSRSVASICQLYDELYALEHRLSTKLEELAALMKHSRKLGETLEYQPSASRTTSVRKLRNEIQLKCFEKCEALVRVRESQEEKEQEEEAMWPEADIKSEVESLEGDGEDDDDEGRNNEAQNCSLTKEIANNEDKSGSSSDNGEVNSDSDHSFTSNSSDKAIEKHSENVQAKPKRQRQKRKRNSSSNTEKQARQQRTVGKYKERKMKSIPCKICGLVIEDNFPYAIYRAHLHNHRKRDPLEPLICEICGASLVTPAAFHHHKYYHHSGPDWICDVCGKMFRDKWNLQSHQVVHTREKNFKCHLCSSQFAQSASLKEHLVQIHGKVKGHWFTAGEERKRKCEYPSCNANFSNESELKSHIEQVHPVAEESNNWMCKLCGKVFANQQRLTRHNQVHTKEKRHKCPVCESLFSQPNALKEHLILIHGQGNEQEDLQCTQSECDLKFKCSSYLYRHLRKKHGIYTAKHRAPKNQ